MANGTVGAPAWEPKGTLEEFQDRLLKSRGEGKTYRKISHEEGCSIATLYVFFKKNPEIKKFIDQKENDEVNNNLLSTALEVALQDRHPTMLIFLLKARLGYKDGSETKPARSAEEEEKDPLVRPITSEEACKILEARRKIVPSAS